MLLGISGSSHTGNIGSIWSCAKWLELCPIGTVVRNGCDVRAPMGAGVHLRKVQLHRGQDPGGTEWVPCSAQDPHKWRVPDEPWFPLRSKDVFLPVQVVKRGGNEE